MEAQRKRFFFCFCFAGGQRCRRGCHTNQVSMILSIAQYLPNYNNKTDKPLGKHFWLSRELLNLKPDHKSSLIYFFPTHTSPTKMLLQFDGKGRILFCFCSPSTREKNKNSNFLKQTNWSRSDKELAIWASRRPTETRPNWNYTLSKFKKHCFCWTKNCHENTAIAISLMDLCRVNNFPLQDPGSRFMTW